VESGLTALPPPPCHAFHSLPASISLLPSFALIILKLESFPNCAETQDEIEEDEPSAKPDEDEVEDEVAGSGEIGSYNATEEQLPTRRKVERPQMKPLFASEETETEEAENSELPVSKRASLWRAVEHSFSPLRPLVYDC
jgi:hypothetical protein